MNTIYSENDLNAIKQQKNKRWILLAIPCMLLLAVMLYSLMIRLEWLTSGSTVLLGVLLIAGYDFAIKPLACYQRHLTSSLHGRTRACDLPFVSLSENVDMVEGIRCRQLLCSDTDNKGRPYDRLFYFDAEKEFPDVQAGDMLHIVHYDLIVANLHRA